MKVFDIKYVNSKSCIPLLKVIITSYKYFISFIFFIEYLTNQGADLLPYKNLAIQFFFLIIKNEILIIFILHFIDKSFQISEISDYE